MNIEKQLLNLQKDQAKKLDEVKGDRKKANQLKKAFEKQITKSYNPKKECNVYQDVYQELKHISKICSEVATILSYLIDVGWTGKAKERLNKNGITSKREQFTEDTKKKIMDIYNHTYNNHIDEDDVDADLFCVSVLSCEDSSKLNRIIKAAYYLSPYSPY